MENKKKFIFWVLICSLPLIFFESMARLLLPSFQQTLSPDTTVQLHPIHGYVLTPNLYYKRSHPSYESPITFFTNELGLRDKPISKKDSVDILAVGDSFTAGYGLKWEDAWPHQLNVLINSRGKLSKPLRVVNGGVNGYSIRQIRTFSEDLIAKLKPKMVILGLYPRAFGRLKNPFKMYRGILVKEGNFSNMHFLENGNYLTSPYSRPWIKNLDLWMQEHFYFGTYSLQFMYTIKNYLTVILRGQNKFKKEEILVEVQRELREFLQEVKKFIFSTREAGIPLIVLLVNPQEANGTFNEKERVYNSVIKQLCQELSITVVDPLPMLEKLAKGKPFIIRQIKNNHWTKFAHRVVGNEVEKTFWKKFGEPHCSVSAQVGQFRGAC